MEYACAMPSIAPPFEEATMPAARLAFLLALTLLCACDGGSKEAASPPARIFGTQRDALDKAKGVQDTLKQAAEQQRQQQEEQAK
jgi:hypothetical protein